MKYFKNLERMPCTYRTICQKITNEPEKIEPVVMVHGGAGPLFDDLIIPKMEAVKKAAQIGYKAMTQGGAVEAVEQGLRFMESTGHFNTGNGSNINEEGAVELDAGIMAGNLAFGSVICVRDIEHPISLARLVMEKTRNTSMSSIGAINFAKSQNMKILPPGALVCERAKKLLKKIKLYDGREVGIAGVVALDQRGHMAAGSSSGGTNGKMAGRAGDTWLPGGGIYADDLVATVAVTGDSSAIVKTCLSYSIIDSIDTGLSSSEAIQKGLFLMDMRLQGAGGAIAISKDGDVGFYFNTKRMPWAYQTLSKLHYGIEKGEHNMEDSKI